MHVLFFIHSLSAGGAERVTTTLANHWVANGWRVTIVTATGRDRDFYVIDGQINRIALGVDAYSANARQALINNFRRIRALRTALRQESPDVAVGMMPTGNALLALAGHGLDVVTVGSERIHPPTMPLGRAWGTVRRLTYPKLTALVAQTQQSAAWLRLNAPASRIEVIPNPVHYPIPIQEPRVPPTSTSVLTGRPRILLAVGRLDEQKGFDRLVEAFAAIGHDYPEWCLAILGEGGLRPKLEQQAVTLGIADRVHLPGAVGNVAEWFEAADLFVMSSRFEGFPNTLLEALAHGLPAVAVDCETGPRDILRHEVDGLLVPQDDPEALCSAIVRLMGDEPLRARFAERAVEARERFDVRRVAAMWEELFSNV